MKLPTQFLFESNTNQKWSEVNPCGLIMSKSHVISGLDALKQSCQDHLEAGCT